MILRLFIIQDDIINGDSSFLRLSLRTGSGRNDTKAERRDRIYSGMTEAKCHASKRNDNAKGMLLDSSPKSLTLLWQQVAKYRISRRCRSE